jgi:WD40 repeat protein/serine/threonine protein kinase/Leucine-rich repeat (LRR) protein
MSTTNCFDVSTYKRMVAGQLPDAELETVYEHIERCDRCFQVVRNLPEDSLVAAMRANDKWPKSDLGPAFIRDLAQKVLKQSESLKPTLFACPGCGQQLKVKKELAGQKVKCPKCGEAMRIPAAAVWVPQSSSATKEDAAASETLPPKDLRSPAVMDAPTVPPSSPRIPKGEICSAPGVKSGLSENLPEGLLIAYDGPLPKVPGYEILGTLGRGGMGVVYKARHEKLRRLVALKMILAGSSAGEQERTRFLVEAKAVASLQHRNIVQIHEIGEHEGLPYFSLEYCEGGSLAQKMNGTPLPPMEAAKVVMTLAEAVQAAHEAGIIHRDLKPANVLLASVGSDRSAPSGKSRPPVEAIPKITDFGLAKDMGEVGQTATGAIMGTPSYMAPEQASGQSKAIGPPADIYALGAILYECLTGRPPFKAATALETILQVVNEEPVPPSELIPKVPRDLETICLKCLQKAPANRYATAAALADDLGHYLRGEPIQARPVSRAERTWRWCRRNPAVAGLLGAVAATLIVGSIVASVFAMLADANAQWADINAGRANANAERADRERADALEQKTKAEKARDNEKEARKKEEEAHKKTKAAEEETAEALALTKSMLAQSRWNEGQVRLANDLLEEVPYRFRFDGWRILKRQFEGDSLFTLCGHQDTVTSVCYSPDGQRLASASLDNLVKVWDARSGLELLSFKGGTRSVSFSPDGERLAAIGPDSEVRVWDARNGRELLTFKGHPFLAVKSVCFSPDGKRLSTASSTVKVWDARSGQEMLNLAGVDAASNVCFSPDGQRLAAAGNVTVLGPMVKVWDSHGGKELLTIKAVDARSGSGQERLTSKGGIKYRTDGSQVGWGLFGISVCFSPDGQRLAGSADGTVKVWDAHSGQQLLIVNGLGVGAQNVCFSPDGQRLALGGKDGTMKVLDVRNGQELLTLRGTSLGRTGENLSGTNCFSPDGQRLAIAGYDQTVRIWDLRGRQELLTLKGPSRGSSVPAARSVCFSPDGQRFAAAGGNGTLKVWDARSGQELLTLKGHEGTVWSLCFSPDGQRLASAGRKIKLWDARSGEELLTLKEHSGSVKSVCFSPDGQRLASGSEDKSVKVWNVSSGEELLAFNGHAGAVSSVCFSPDGKRLASASGDKTVKILDALSGKELLTFKGHTSGAGSVWFSPDGQRVVSAGAKVKVWEPHSGKELLTLHSGPITKVCFSPNGQLLATAGHDQIVRIWDALSGQELLAFKGHVGAVMSVCFSPNGKRLASTDYEGIVKMWDVRVAEGLLALKGHTGNVMSVCFSPDGKQLASASADRTVKVWDTRNAQELRTFHTDSICMCFSPDGQRLASASWDQTVKVWDARNGQGFLTLEGKIGSPDATFSDVMHLMDIESLKKGWVTSLCYSPDGQRIIGRISSVGALVWDADTGKRQVWENDPVPLPFVSGAISPDGKRLALGAGERCFLIDLGPPSDEEIGYRNTVTRLDTDWHEQQALRHEKEKNWYPAAFHLSRVLQARFNLPEYWRRLDEACRQLKSWQHAQEVCTWLAKERPNLDVKLQRTQFQGTPWMYFFLAKAHHRFGNNDKAKECYDLAQLPKKLSEDERPMFEPLPRETAVELGLEDKDKGKGNDRVIGEKNFPPPPGGVGDPLPSKKSPAEKIDAATIVAYEKLGATFRVEQGGLPVFQFKTFLNSKLPNAAVPFGLELHNVKNQDLKELASLANLTLLSMDGSSKVTDQGLKALAPLKKLTILELGETKVTDAGLKELASLTNLTRLSLKNTKVMGAGLKELAPLKSFQALNLQGAQVTDASLKELASLTNLTDLHLGFTKVTDVGLKELAPLKNLEVLVLNETQVTDGGLKALASLVNLHTLYLEDTNVTDAGLKELAPLTNLNALWLVRTKVTDVGLTELASLKHLGSLHLAGTKVTDIGVAELRKSLPNCKIYR